MQLDPAAGPWPSLPDGAEQVDLGTTDAMDSDATDAMDSDATEAMDSDAGDAIVPSRPAGTGPRSPWVCPFLRATDEDDALLAPVATPDPANRCAALREAVPQSLRQQGLVCLTSGHVECPRYLRGSMGAAEPRTVERGERTVTPATVGALIAFAAAFVLSVAFVVANGGLVLTASATRSGAGDIAAGNSPAPFASNAVPSAPTPTVSVASQAPFLTPSPTHSAGTAARPLPSSARYALLKVCPDAPDCWIYVVRSGDNLSSIANYFGVRLKTVETLNPWVSSIQLRAGQQLRLPPPTR